MVLYWEKGEENGSDYNRAYNGNGTVLMRKSRVSIGNSSSLLFHVEEILRSRNLRLPHALAVTTRDTGSGFRVWDPRLRERDIFVCH